MEQQIEKKLHDGIVMSHLVIENESHMHSGPATDSHFKLVMVSEAFDGVRPVARHQMIYKILADELAGEVHALALHLYTPAEWAAKGEVIPESPKCRGAH